MEGSLDDHILFSMNATAKLMFFPGRDIKLFPQTSNFLTMLVSGRGTVVPCAYDSSIFNQYGADFSPDAR